MKGDTVDTELPPKHETTAQRSGDTEPSAFVRVEDSIEPDPSFRWGHDIVRGLSAPGRSALIESIASRLFDGEIATRSEQVVAATWLNICAARELR